MMLRPSYLDLINVVNKEAEPGKEPLIQSRYSIVIATAKRARQLIAGDEALVIENGRKPLSIAIDELYHSKVKIVAENDSPEGRGLKGDRETVPCSLCTWRWSFLRYRYFCDGSNRLWLQKFFKYGIRRELNEITLYIPWLR